MVPVADIWEEAGKIIGNSREDFRYRRITDAVELLANKGEFDPLIGFLDICVSDQLVTLPREVEVVTACNMVGHPAVARDQIFQFHLNGPGQCGPDLPWSWFDFGEVCTYRQLEKPSKLLGFCKVADDVNCELWVYGFDSDNNSIRSQDANGNWVEGWKVPVFTDQQALPADAPVFARISRVRKGYTKGPVRLATLDNSGGTGVLLGVYQWNETEPTYRRIKLAQKVAWVRIAFRRRVFKVENQFDLLPVNNSQAVIMMLRAMRLYDKEDFATAEAAESTAVRWITEEQHTSSAPVAQPMQFHDNSPLNDPCDDLQ